MDLSDLFRYSDKCRKVLREALEANPAVWTRPIEPALQEFTTIREIAVHTAGAEERWVKMRIGGEAVPFYKDRAPVGIAEVFADWDRFRNETYAFLGRQSEKSLQKAYHVTLGEDIWTGDLTAEQILFHVLNHETHHRAQVSMAMQQMNLDPPDFDYIFWK